MPGIGQRPRLSSAIKNIERCQELWAAGLPAVYSVIGDSKDLSSTEPRYSPYTVANNPNWHGVLAQCSGGLLQSGNVYAESGKSTKQALENSRGFTGPGETGLSQTELAASDNSHMVLWKLSGNTSTGHPGTTTANVAIIRTGIQQLQAAGKSVFLVADTPSGTDSGGLQTLRSLHDKMSEFAAMNGCGWLVQDSPVAFGKDAAIVSGYGLDTVHPNEPAHELVGKRLAAQFVEIVGTAGWPAAKRNSHAQGSNDLLNYGFSPNATGGSTPYAPTVGSFSGTSPFNSAGLVADTATGYWLRKAPGAAGSISWTGLLNTPTVVAGNWWKLSCCIRGNASETAANKITLRWTLNWKTGGSDILTPTAGVVARVAPLWYAIPYGGDARFVQVVAKAPPGATSYHNEMTWQLYGTTTTAYLDVKDMVVTKLADIDPDLDAWMDKKYLWKTG